MSDSIGRGVIELVTDARQFKAGMDDAKKSIMDLGSRQAGTSAAAAKSIDGYIQRLQIQNATLGKSSRETELYKLAVKGASDAQIKLADAALRAGEAHKKSIADGIALAAKQQAASIAAIAATQARVDNLKEQGRALGNVIGTALRWTGVALVTGLIAGAAAAHMLIQKAAGFQDLGEKIGDTAENIASLAVSAATGGASMDQVAAASVKLTKGLTGVDDETKDAGAAISALGLDIDKFKQLKPADQFETVAKALEGFADGSAKTAVAVALFGKAGADLLPFLKELGKEGGRQKILTQEQINLADEHADKQAKLKAQIGLHAAAIVSEMLPAYNELSSSFLGLIKHIAGVEDGAQGLANSDGIKKFAERGIDYIVWIIDRIDDMVRAFRIAATTIAAIGATIKTHIDVVANPVETVKGPWRKVEQAKGFWDTTKAVANATFNPLAYFDPGSAATIAGAAVKDVKDIANAPRLSDFRAQQKANSLTNQTPPKDAADKPQLRFSGKSDKEKKGGADAEAKKAAEEAKARLALELDEIKKSTEATGYVYANAEKIMQAQRAANLVDDKKYFDEKLRYLNLNAANQEDGLQKGIARMQQEQLSFAKGSKEEIEGSRKIQDEVAKLAKVRADAAANRTIHSIQEVAATAKEAKALADSTEVQKQYIDAIVRRNAAEQAGVGKGSYARENQAGLNSIDDKFIGVQQQIQRDRENHPGTDSKVYDDQLALAKSTYEQEVVLYKKRSADILENESQWVNGANEAMANYLATAKNVAKQTEDVFSNAFKGLEEAMVSFITTGKADFKSLANSIIAEFARIQAKKAIAEAMGMFKDSGMAGMFGMAGSGGSQPEQLSGPGYTGGGDSGGGTNWMSLISGVIGLFGGGAAEGGPVKAGKMYRVNEKGPELLTVHGKPYLMMGGSDGSITPNAALGTGTGGGGPVNVHNEFHITGAVDNRSRAQIAADTGQSVQRAVSRDT